MGLQNSEIIICKNIKLEKSYKDVLNYTENQMVALCRTHAVASANDYSFIRSERNVIKTQFSYNDALKCNYMAFQNPDYSNKWFFAFIDDIEYASDGTSKIHYTIDEFSTWFDYWNPQTCFVIREHVSNDAVGLHTIPEGLEYGEYIINSAGAVSNLLRKDACYICMGVSYVPSNTLWQNDDRYYGDIYSGLIYVVFDQNASASKFIKAYDKMGRGSAIFTIYMIPASLCDSLNWQSADYDDEIKNIRFALLPSSIGSSTIQDNINLTINNNLNGYVPKNNKLFTFPYNYLSITNNCGTQIDFHYEDFINNSPSFKLIGLETPNIPIMLIPKNYKKYGGTALHDSFYNYGISGGKFPSCSWQTDLYTNWMTQNGVNIAGNKIDAPTKQAIGGSLQALTSGATGDFGGVGAGLGQMFGSVQEMYRHSMESPTINGQTSVSDLSFAHDQLTFTYYKMSIRDEYARIIDDWFTRFGYKINRNKIPNQIGRRNWNFVQIGASENIGYSTNDVRSVPSSSMETINSIYRAGVTIWHSHDNLGNYSLDNSIV